MSKSLAWVLLAASLLPAAELKKSPIDKAAIEVYVRHLFVFNPQIKLEVLDPQPSDLPGFDRIIVRASNDKSNQDFPLYVSKDGRRMVQGAVFDLGQNPFKADLDKLKTDFAPSFGTPGASVVIVAFSDFQCPYCKDEAQTIRQNLLSAYPSQVRLYFKDFPLEQIHDWAKPASVAGRCVFRQDPAAWWRYHDWIFSRQTDIKAATVKDQVLDWAKSEKDLDGLQLGRCIDTRATAEEVDRTLAQGRDLGVVSTPTLFINGRRIQEKVDWPTLRALIDNEIEYQKVARNAGEDCGCELKLDVPGIPSTSPKALPGLRKK
jgi:protein-disulfide isomerase